MAQTIQQAFAAQARLSRNRFIETLEKGAGRAVQAGVLRQCVEPNASTAFGREHGFASVSDLADFKAAVPIRHYEELDHRTDRCKGRRQHRDVGNGVFLDARVAHARG